jgi:2-polyprenyl-6-methoxyphenol hydroxylase-like FAD-dependent oxidoreductase
MPGYDPFPQRDLGIGTYSMSRPLIELVVRRRVERHANITLRPRCRVRDLVPSADRAAVIAVRFENDGESETLPADLVVDASGRGNLTSELLEAIGQPMPEETVIGVDIGYATAVFAIPDDDPSDWKALRTLPNIRESSRGGLMLPLEGGRWMVTLGGRRGEKPPGMPKDFWPLLSTCGRRRCITRSGTPNGSATSSALAFRRAFGATSSGLKRSRTGCFLSATPSAASTRCTAKA